MALIFHEYPSGAQFVVVSHYCPIGRPLPSFKTMSVKHILKKSLINCLQLSHTKTRDDEKVTSFMKSWYTAFSFSG